VRIGLIVNPLAGIGGPLALKGSDGTVAMQAIERGATPLALGRVTTALVSLVGQESRFELLTCADDMGEAAASAAGIPAQFVYRSERWPSTRQDTIRAATALQLAGIDLLLFGGGDGTARDLMSAVPTTLPVLGIPAGVKMHSAVFATSPRSAGAMLVALINRGINATEMVDIVDRAVEGGAPALFGALRTPCAPGLRQAAKAIGPLEDGHDLAGACAAVANRLRQTGMAIIGPGSTMLQIKNALAPGGSLLGVDVFSKGRLLHADADADILLGVCEGAELILGVIGGQGILVGRGNQQLTPKILDAIGSRGLTIVASAAKLASLASGKLMVDSGDPRLDERLSGHVRVQTAAHRQMIIKLVPA